MNFLKIQYHRELVLLFFVSYSIWLIGGRAEFHEPTSSVLIYDIETDSWGTGPALPRAAYEAGAATLNGELLVYCRFATEEWPESAYLIYRNAEWVEGPGGLGHIESGALATINLG